jgi:hypothetical protein
MLERKKVLISDCAPGGKSFLRKACLIRRAGVNMQPSKKVHSYNRIGPVALSVTFIRRA